MQYFLISFVALISFFGFYIWNLQTENRELLKQLSALEATYSAVRESQNLTLKYASKELYSAKKRIEKIEFKGGNCEAELQSYKILIRAF